MFIIQLVVLVFILLVSLQTLVQNVFGYWPGLYIYMLTLVVYMQHVIEFVCLH